MGGIGGLFSQWLPRINQCPGLPDSMKSLFSKRTESAHVSKEFWMHDQSCLACYECESRFTLLKRKHHCRVCGRVFCAKCTSNVVPCPSNDQSTTSEKRVRVCNFCFKEWEQHFAMGNDNASQGSSSYNSVSSSSPLSVVSTRSRGTVPNGSPTFASGSPSAGLGFLYHDQSPDRFRSDNDDGDFGVYASDYQSKQYSRTNGYYGHLAFDERDSDYGLEKVEPDIDIDSKSMDGTSMYGSCDSPGLEEEQKIMEEVVPGGEEVEPPSSDYVAESVDTESVDFENNVVLWFPPEPEDEEDESEASLFDDDDGDVTGEWRHLRTSSSFESEELHSRDRSNKEHKKATKYVVDRHFKALVAQLLQAENVPVGEAGDKESWLKIITSLAFEGAMLLKPDTSKGGVMDTGGYVKIKCLASGRHSDSNVVKGVICTKNVAHRQMVSNLEKPRILILGGALEYQRVSDFLSSFNTLLEQEMDHLKMAVAKIEAHHPDILLVEKSVSRYAQEYLLTKEITLVLNIKRPLLERIARCTGAQIVPSIDHLSSPKLGYCDQFYVKRSLEEHGTAGQDGKKLVKTLMYFEGCPKPLGCTVLLRGANGDELKKVKHVVQYGIFAAYHLALETSFLADEGASLTQLPLDTPITVSLPDKRSSIDSGNDCFEDYARRACADLPSAQVDRKQMLEEPASLKEEFFPSPSDHQSILVSLSSRCLRKGTVCGRSHLFRIKYYSNFDKPLGRYLSDHLFDQNYRCHFCEMPSDAHDQCYTHRQGTLTISVKKLPEIMLHGEEDSKIWMWHRCLRCPRINGVPPATRRIVMSDAAWGLSFGKFLDLSFSNHAAASRAASCGHSLHRDCLRFYGFGKMVACFRYASIDVHSVHLPPTKLEFNYENQDWIQKKLNQVVVKAATMFSDVVNSLRTLAEKQSGRGQLPNSVKVPEARCQIASLEIMLQNEKMDFEKLVENIQTKETKEAEPVLDILEINRLGRQLLFQSYMWDHRLQYVASLDKKASRDDIDFISPESAKISLSNNKLSDPHTVAGPVNNLSGRDTVPVDAEGDETNYQSEKGNNTNHQEMLHGSNWTGKSLSNPSGVSTMAESDPLDKDINVLRTLPDGQCPREANLSESLDAESTGKNHAPAGIVKDDISPHSMNAERDSSTAVGTSGKLAAEDKATELTGSKVFQLPSLKIYDQTEDTMSWLRMPFVSFYRSFTKSLPVNVQKMENYNGYNPVYISTFREPESQVGSRGMFPVGLNGIVVPVFDDEPTSIISHALLSPDYVVQLSDDTERSKDAIESMGSRQIDPGNLQVSQSADEAVLQSYRSPVRDESFISTGPRNFAITELHSYNKILHAKVTFDHPLGEVKYKVTCYYARRFEALRKICCPSKVDFVRSLSRCKQWGAKGGKSNVFFAKTLDDRFIIKQVTKTELESFLTLAPEYFKHLSESIDSGSQTCLAKILGIYQVTTKNAKGGKNLQMDLLVMENLLFGRNLTRLYDLKGSTRARYNPDPGGSNKVLLDQNLIEAMPTSPIFLGNEAKRLLERAVWNDTAFLASVDVMDYSLLVGVDEEKHELVLGIIDFMRQYTWDKHLETYVKASGILGGPKNASPTVISPQQYKKRFRKAMTTYFPVVPDEWSRPTIIPSKSQASQAEDNIRCGINSIE